MKSNPRAAAPAGRVTYYCTEGYEKVPGRRFPVSGPANGLKRRHRGDNTGLHDAFRIPLDRRFHLTDETSNLPRTENMQLPLEVTSRNVSLSDTATHTIRERAQKLETFHERITSCRVAVEQPHRGQQRGARYLVRIDVTVPQGEIVTKRKPHSNLLTAIQDAFDTAERQLRELRRRQLQT